MSKAHQVNADVLFCQGYEFYHEENLYKDYHSRIGLFTGNEMYAILLQHNVIPVLSVILKTDWRKKVGYQEESKLYYGCEDYDYWLRLSKSGATFYGMEEKLFYYRIHSSGMSQDKTMMLQSVANVLIKNYDPQRVDARSFNSTIKNISETLINSYLKNNQKNKAIEVSNAWSKVRQSIYTHLLKFLLTYFPTVISGFLIKIIHILRLKLVTLKMKLNI